MENEKGVFADTGLVEHGGSSGGPAHYFLIYYIKDPDSVEARMRLLQRPKFRVRD